MLRAKLESLPPLEFGTMTAREFYLYESKLSAVGSEVYEVGSAIRWNVAVSPTRWYLRA